jgi:hypothetical protein
MESRYPQLQQLITSATEVRGGLALAHFHRLDVLYLLLKCRVGGFLGSGVFIKVKVAQIKKLRPKIRVKITKSSWEINFKWPILRGF